ncbi:Capsular polysaccharide biosynthesis protein (plasmid) [Tsukamurella tyrosinosolvens]|uniref:Capsular polysaccharide biosynthesis protein n=1 Tax=Tsukamurella tyrosinosolvens TaxID=57704 RepID=A0A1H4KVB4_TSUTY|nr:Capsular polysaccharide biosynthesis protein [Tsukamurella tyrosinosolvens]VEH94718.1 Capsular polysaccharide biosynthesis protein [Tsukamurella tyrosinosolvens]
MPVPPGLRFREPVPKGRQVKLTDLPRVARDHWILVTVTVIVALAVGVGASLATPREYRAATQLYISAGQDTSGQEAYNGVVMSQQQVASYAILIASEETASRALRSIGSNENPAELASRITTSYIPETVILNVSVTDSDAKHAADLINAVSRSFVKYLDELNQSSAKDIKASRATLVRQADPPAAPESRYVARNGALALVLGLLLGLGFAYARESFRRGPSPAVPAPSADDAPTSPIAATGAEAAARGTPRLVAVVAAPDEAPSTDSPLARITRNVPVGPVAMPALRPGDRESSRAMTRWRDRVEEVPEEDELPLPVLEEKSSDDAPDEVANSAAPDTADSEETAADETGAENEERDLGNARKAL